MRVGHAILDEARRTEKGLSKGEVQKRRYPWSECIEDGTKMGLSKDEARDRCLYIACCVSKLPNKPKESGACRAIDCNKPPKGVKKPE